jgi:predicted porin
MKKLLVIIAVVALFAAPAAAVDWNFYGSARIATFYTSTDGGDLVLTTTGDDSDDGTRWEMQGNSRIGARVKGETVSGRVELSTYGLDGGDSSVGTRLLYGDWNFGAGSLRVGKSYSPTSQFISTQAFDGDLGLLGTGTFYGRRPAGLTLSFGGLSVALLDPATTNDLGVAGVGSTGDIDSYIPKIEAMGHGF